MRDTLRPGATPGSALYELINADSRLEEQTCYRTLDTIRDVKKDLESAAVTIAASAKDAQRFAELAGQVEAKKTELAEAETRLEGARRQSEELKAQNLAGTLSVLKSTGFFGTVSPEQVVKDYLSRNENRLTISGSTVFVTPFGFFVHEPSVRMDGGTGKETLVFQPLDLHRGDPILAAYRDQQIKYLTTFKAGARFSADEFTIDPAGETVKDISFRSPVSWQWTIRRGWFRPLEKKEEGSITVRGGAAAATDVLTPAPLRVQIQSDGWFSFPKKIIEGIVTLKDALETVAWIGSLLLAAFGIGRYFGVGRYTRREEDEDPPASP